MRKFFQEKPWTSVYAWLDNNKIPVQVYHYRTNKVKFILVDSINDNWSYFDPDDCLYCILKDAKNRFRILQNRGRSTPSIIFYSLEELDDWLIAELL